MQKVNWLVSAIHIFKRDIMHIYISICMMFMAYIGYFLYTDRRDSVFLFIEKTWGLEHQPMGIFLLLGGLGLLYVTIQQRSTLVIRAALTSPFSFYILSSFIWALESTYYQISVMYSIILLYIYLEVIDYE